MSNKSVVSSKNKFVIINFKKHLLIIAIFRLLVLLVLVDFLTGVQIGCLILVNILGFLTVYFS